MMKKTGKLRKFLSSCNDGLLERSEVIKKNCIIKWAYLMGKTNGIGHLTDVNRILRVRRDLEMCDMRPLYFYLSES